MTTKDKQLIFRCYECKKNYKKEFNKELIKQFVNIYEFCNGDIKYMDSWERFDETYLPEKGTFYSSLNMEDITDVDHRHANRVFKAFKLKDLGEYHNFYVNADTIQLSDIYKNIRNMCIKVYEVDTIHFLSAPRLAWAACIRKTEVKLELITNVNMLLMIEEGIKGGICHAIHR